MLGHLAADRARVAELDAQILQLQDRIHDLELEKTRTQDRLDTYCYPVLRLPNEITSEIFVHYLPAFPLRPPLTGIMSPTLLTQVCRAWREIALSTPTLWRAISFMGLEIPYAQAVEIVDVWLRRSRSCPLSIEVYCPGNDLSGLLSRIFEEAAHLEELDLFISAPHIPSTPRRMPLLRHLDLFLEDLPPESNIGTFHGGQVPRPRLQGVWQAWVRHLPWRSPGIGQMSLSLCYRVKSGCRARLVGSNCHLDQPLQSF